MGQDRQASLGVLVVEGVSMCKAGPCKKIPPRHNHWWVYHNEGQKGVIVVNKGI